MIPQIREINFGPGTDKAYATLHQATVTLAEMGERTIQTQVRIDGDVVPDFTGWELEFRGERFVLPVREPQAMKDNTTLNSLVDLTFVSWPVQELKRYFFFDTPSTAAGTAIADQYVTPLRVNIETFVQVFNKVLDYYFDGSIVMDLFGAGQHIYSTDPAEIDINYTHIWDLLTKIYEVYDVRWNIEYNSVNQRYTIKVGYEADYIDDHDFEYGYQGGLLKFERQVPESDITNILLGRGGEKNLPYRYFKKTDLQNPEWTADPDAIPELANIYYDRLHDFVYRWYIRGWMQNEHCDQSYAPYPVYSESDIPAPPQVSTELHDSCLYAFHRGQTDERFRPVEYVKDDESILKYGEHWGALDNNDDIYPTIQGYSRDPIGRVDETVDISDIITDDIEAMAAAASVESNVGGTKNVTKEIAAYGSQTETFIGESFEIPTGKTANLSLTGGTQPYFAFISGGSDAENALVSVDSTTAILHVVNESTGTEIPFGSGIPAGNYHYKITLTAQNRNAATKQVTFGVNGVKMVIADVDENAWKPTFDIWVKDIWNTRESQGADESDEEYALRVWRPILGDRLGNEAKVAFSDGFMSISEDYDFVIASYPVVDRTKTTLSNVPSEWKITLYKSSAEYDATGLYIPNATASGKPVRGDHFYFLGIDMPFEYVLWGEERVCQWKLDNLPGLSDVFPTWVITLDKVRVHTLEDGDYGQTLAERLATGAKIRTKDSRFTQGTVLTLYVQSITYRWNEPTKESPYVVPDIEVVLSDKVVAYESPVNTLSGQVDIIKSTYAKNSDIETVVRRVAAPMFLKKTGEADTSNSPTKFSSKVSSANFRQGDVGGAGWGSYEDGSGKSVYEVDKLIVRDEMRVNSLVVNQISYVGGLRIESAANIECTQVIETPTGYQCFFDQKKGSVANLFRVGDIAYLHDFNPNNITLRYSKREVIALDENSITLEKVDHPYVVVIDEESGLTETRHTVDGTGVPQKGDEIVQYGNRDEEARQYVIITDVIGGGYQRMLSNLNHAAAYGKEYYFAGISGSHEKFVRLLEKRYGELEDRQYAILGYSEHVPSPRWFVGDADSEYAEWADGILNIKGRISVRQNDGSYIAMSKYINDTSYLTKALKEESTLIEGGLILTTMIQLGETIEPEPESEDDEVEPIFRIWSGINGSLDMTLQYPERTIAAWYGGEMLEKDDWDHMTPAEQIEHRYAKTLFRHDGSGYLAGGNIYWDQYGYGGIPGITWNNEGGTDTVTIGANVMLESLSGVDSSVTDLINLARQINNMFEIVDLGNNISAVHVKGGMPFYSDSFVSAGGVGSGGGGGGGVDLDRVWESFENNVDKPNAKIHPAHIPIDGNTIYIDNGVLKSSGGVTSVAMTVPVGMLVSGSPITSTGTLAVTFAPGYGLPEFEDGKIKSSNLPNMYIGSTAVQFGTTPEALTGITTITSSGLATVGSLKLADGAPTLTWDSNASAWKLEGNFYATGFVSAGGVGSGGGGATDLNRVWESLTNNTDKPNVTIHPAHIPIDGTTIYVQNGVLKSIGSVTSVAGLVGDIQEIQLAAALGIGSVASGNNHLVTGGTVFAYVNDAVSSAIKFRGITTTALTDGSTTNPITINGSSYTARSGDLVLYGTLEFLWTGGKWQLMGDEDSYVKKTQTINGKSLSGNVTLTLDDIGDGSSRKLSDYFLVANFTRNNIKSTLGIYDWALAEHLAFSALPEMYIGNARVQGSAQSAQNVGGLGSLTGSGLFSTTNYMQATRFILADGVYIEYDSQNGGIHVVGAGLYADNYLTAGGIGSGGGSNFDLGAMWTSLRNTPTATSDVTSTTEIAVAHIPNLEMSKINGLSEAIAEAGKVKKVQVGSSSPILPDSSGTIFLPAYPTSLANPYSLTFGSKTYDGSAAKTITASDLGALTSVSFGDLTSHPTTLGGYGITDAAITTDYSYSDRKILTIGSSSIYVLTSHQSLSGYATQSWVQTWVGQQGYLTGITSTMVTNALGYTPVNSTTLSNYVQKAGDTMSGNLTFNHNVAVNFKDSGGTARNGITLASNVLYVGSTIRSTYLQGYDISFYYDGGNLGMKIADSGRTTIYGGLALADDGPYMDYDATANAWHIHGNLYADGFLTAGGVGGANNTLVTIADAQTITGAKTFSAAATFNNNVTVNSSKTLTATNLKATNISPVTGSVVYLAKTSGMVVIGQSYSGNYAFYVNGASYSTGGWSGSDARLKKDIEPMGHEEAIDIIMALKPSKWTWNDNTTIAGQKSAGLIAQDVQPVMPCAVSGTDYLAMNYSTFVAPVVSTLQSHEERIEFLEKENAELKKQLGYAS